MKLNRFMQYFLRVKHPRVEETTIRFDVDGHEAKITTVEYDVATNRWVVRLDLGQSRKNA